MFLRSMLLAGTTLGLCVAAPLSAQSKPGPQGDKECSMKEGAKPQPFKLTDEQKSKFETIRAKHAVELTAKRQALRAAEKPFFKAVQSPETSTEQLKELHKAVSSARFDLLVAERALRLELRTVLTPEQQAKADKFLSEKREQWQRKGRESKGAERKGADK